MIGDTLPPQEDQDLFHKQIEQAVEGYHLKEKTIYNQKGYTTSSGKLSKHLVDTMNKWFIKNKMFYPTIWVLWNKTYDILQFKQRTHYEQSS